ncbi:MAG: hypothetical protein GXO30_03790 [Epsilonproteobacteria bacterium]|nr:hypothetical protein [Campylobacterota bacterium]
MKVEYRLFEMLLAKASITKKDFADYAKISYFTVTGWKKVGKVPTYAMVIARDMAYRKKLDNHTKEKLKGFKTNCAVTSTLTDKEKKMIKSAFWGTKYSVEEIVDKVLNHDEKFLKRFEENVPQNIQDKILEETYA